MHFPLFQINKTIGPSELIKGIFSIWGEIGVGKTIFAIQTAIINTLNGKNVIYIYSKPNFPYERIKNIVQTNSKNLLDKILFIQVLDYQELYTIIFNLEFNILDNLSEKDNNIDLIIIDSITNLYRLELNRDKKEKNFILNYKLNQILANLYNLNSNYEIEILIINEVSRANINGQTIQIQSGGKIMEDYFSILSEKGFK